MLTATPPVSEFSLVWGVKHPILTWCINWIFAGKPLDVALARNVDKAVVILPIAFVIMIMIFLSLRRYKFYKLAYAAAIANVGVSVLMLFLYGNDPIYMKDRSDYKESQQMIVRQYQPGDMVLIKSYGSPIWDYWMNWTDPKVQWTSLPYYFPAPAFIDKYLTSNDPEDALDTISLAILNQSIQPGKRIWLVIASDSPGASLGIEKSGWQIDPKIMSVLCLKVKAEIQSCVYLILIRI
jgi:hypothetical protein